MVHIHLIEDIAYVRVLSLVDRSEEMIFDGTRRRRRKLRGLIPGVIIVPIMVAAVLVGTPLWRLVGLS